VHANRLCRGTELQLQLQLQLQLLSLLTSAVHCCMWLALGFGRFILGNRSQNAFEEWVAYRAYQGNCRKQNSFVLAENRMTSRFLGRPVCHLLIHYNFFNILLTSMHLWYITRGPYAPPTYLCIYDTSHVGHTPRLHMYAFMIHHTWTTRPGYISMHLWYITRGPYAPATDLCIYDTSHVGHTPHLHYLPWFDHKIILPLWIHCNLLPSSPTHVQIYFSALFANARPVRRQTTQTS
jgi:hypothetical protein